MQEFGDSCELLEQLVALASGEADQGDGNELFSKWDKTLEEGVRPMSP